MIKKDWQRKAKYFLNKMIIKTKKFKKTIRKKPKQN